MSAATQAAVSITVDDKKIEVQPGRTLLDACRQAGADIPVLCDFKGLEPVGACRLCLVEIEGTSKLVPACTTLPGPDLVIRTRSPRLDKYRRMIVELLFSERNHVCAVCVANNACDLQKLAERVGMEHVRYPYLYQQCSIDASHKDFVMDHNRCVMCTRCVRVCDQVESAHVKDVMGRGFLSRIITDFNQPWGESAMCTSCGKCVQVCPTGALWPKQATQGGLRKTPELVSELIETRSRKK